MITTLIALYGAGLSSFLGYLAWRRERRKVRFYTTYNRSHDWSTLIISVVNGGFRPVTLVSAHVEQGEGGYLPTLDEELGFPKRLEDGDSMVLVFDAEDVAPDTTAFVVTDSNRVEHRMTFDQQEWRRFSQPIERSSPGLPPS